MENRSVTDELLDRVRKHVREFRIIAGEVFLNASGVFNDQKTFPYCNNLAEVFDNIAAESNLENCLAKLVRLTEMIKNSSTTNVIIFSREEFLKHADLAFNSQRYKQLEEDIAALTLHFNADTLELISRSSSGI